MKIETNTYNNEKEIVVENILSNVELDEVENLLKHDNNVKSIMFKNQQSVDVWKKINEIILVNKPELEFSFFQNKSWGEWEDLSFFEFLADVQRVTINEWLISDLTPVCNLKNLKKIRLMAGFKSSKVRLKPLQDLKEIEEFHSENIKDIDVISSFDKMKKLGLTSLKTDNLNFLKTLNQLEAIELRLSDKVTDLSGLYDLPKLKRGFFIRNYKIDNVDFITNLHKLEWLSISDYNLVKEFPSFEKLDNLKYLRINTLKNLIDIDGISKAKNLEELAIFAGSKELKPKHFEILKKLQSLKIFRAGFDKLTQEETKEFEQLKRYINH